MYQLAGDTQRHSHVLSSYLKIVAKGGIVAAGKATPQPGSIQYTMTIIIRAKMVPWFRIFVFYMNGNEMVSNSLWVDVKDDCKKVASFPSFLYHQLSYKY